MFCPKHGVVIHWSRIQFYKWVKLMLSKKSQPQKYKHHDFTYLKYLEPGMVAHTCNPSIQEAILEGFRVRGHFEFYSKTLLPK